MVRVARAGVLAGLICMAAASAALPGTSVPNLAAGGWDGDGENEFTPPASGPGPVTSDPAHHYVSNFEARRTGAAANWRVADLTNPNLKPWVIEALRQANADALAGKAMFTREARCWPTGVPAILLNPGRLYFIQTPQEVWIVQEAGHRVRQVFLDRPHSADLRPTWYGESVGHYENGDALVVDTTGMNDKSFVDSYRTPHTSALHVVERFKLIAGGKMLEADFTVDDPGAFNAPWSASKRWKHVAAPLAEESCAENNAGYFGYDLEPMPHADKPDF
jgi:hypothetical protein